MEQKAPAEYNKRALIHKSVHFPPSKLTASQKLNASCFIIGTSHLWSTVHAYMNATTGPIN